MEWLKDRKNLPIVAGLGVVVLLLALVAILFETGVIGGSSAPEATTAPAPVGPGGPTAPGAPVGPGVAPAPLPPGAPYPGGPTVVGASPQTPGAPGTPAAAPGGPVGTPVSNAVVNVAKGPDPFNAPRPKLLSPNAKRPAVAARDVAPFLNIAQLAPRSDSPTLTRQTPLPQIRIHPEESATMRVSGVVQTSNGVHAVLEANGRSQEVQPGDVVSGGTVVSIQSDGLTLRTADNSSVRVPLGTGPTGGQGGFPGGGYPGGGFPGGGYPGPGGFPGGGYPGPGGFPGGGRPGPAGGLGGGGGGISGASN